MGPGRVVPRVCPTDPGPVAGWGYRGEELVAVHDCPVDLARRDNLRTVNRPHGGRTGLANGVIRRGVVG